VPRDPTRIDRLVLWMRADAPGARGAIDGTIYNLPSASRSRSSHWLRVALPAPAGAPFARMAQALH